LKKIIDRVEYTELRSILLVSRVTLCVKATASGRPLAAQPVKIVAGMEAGKTNEFLQALAEAASKVLNLYVFA
jgi:hypothetical protein